MKNGRAKSKPVIVVPRVDLHAPDAAEQFRLAARAVNRRITAAKNPQQAARDLLVSEGLLTPSGRLTKYYR